MGKTHYLTDGTPIRGTEADVLDLLVELAGLQKGMEDPRAELDAVLAKSVIASKLKVERRELQRERSGDPLIYKGYRILRVVSRTQPSRFYFIAGRDGVTQTFWESVRDKAPFFIPLAHRTPRARYLLVCDEGHRLATIDQYFGPPVFPMFDISVVPAVRWTIDANKWDLIGYVTMPRIFGIMPWRWVVDTADSPSLFTPQFELSPGLGLPEYYTPDNWFWRSVPLLDQGVLIESP